MLRNPCQVCFQPAEEFAYSSQNTLFGHMMSQTNKNTQKILKVFLNTMSIDKLSISKLNV